MRTALSRLNPWAPPLALMGVIWFFSAQPDLDSGLGVADLIGRKLVHAGEYGLLCFLWWRALRSHSGVRAALTGALLLTVAYAGIDEYHQTFVTGRTGSPLDVAIDAAGAAMVVALLWRRTADGGRAARHEDGAPRDLKPAPRGDGRQPPPRPEPAPRASRAR